MSLEKFRAWDAERKRMIYQDQEFFTVGLSRDGKNNEVAINKPPKEEE